MEALLESGTNVLAKSFCFYFPYALAILSAAVAIKPMVERVCGVRRFINNYCPIELIP